MTSDALWEKYSYELTHDFNRRMSKMAFLAALAEYGQAVRDRDAEICRILANDIAETERVKSYVHHKRADICAAAISREPLP